MEKMSFETAMKRLEKIAGFLESAALPLEEAISLFAESVTLTDYCNGLLEKTEQKIVQLGTEEKKQDGEIPAKD